MPTKTVKFEFDLTDKVLIKEIGRPGVILSLLFNELGVQYLVTYWHDGQRHSDWLYGWELVNLPEEKK